MTAKPEERAVARKWLTDHANLTLTDLLDSVQSLYADGALIGSGTALQQTGGTVAGALTDLIPGSDSDTVDWPAFWDSWTPGNADAATLLNSGGLADLLDNADVTVRGIAGTTLDRLGNALADGAASGESVDSIADSLTGIVNDPTRAYQIANTELNRAVSQASLDTYAANSVGDWNLLTSPGACADCEDVADSNPYPVDDSENQPPIHPGCRCSVSPAVGPADGPAVDAADG